MSALRQRFLPHVGQYIDVSWKREQLCDEDLENCLGGVTDRFD
jgi:hypothetical protein